jgi:hypothetical protein
MTVTLETFLLALGVASAVLALWFLVRFPQLAPGGFVAALIHVVVALLLAAPVTQIAVQIWNRGYALVAIFGVLLPLLVYTFLSAAWWFKLATETLARYRS